MISPKFLQVETPPVPNVTGNHLALLDKTSAFNQETGPGSRLQVTDEFSGASLVHKDKQDSADEQRLLGVHRPTVDPKAVPISKPNSRNVMRNNLPQGFRPTNTLTKGKSGPVTSSQSIVQHNPNQGKRNHILDLKASAGENVKVYVPENTLDYSQDFEPQLKRQKRVPGLSVDSSNSREEFDPDHHLGPNYTVTHLSKSQGKGQELRSHAPLYSGRVLNFGNQTSSVSTSKVTEFHNLEKIMNSNRNQKSKRKRRRLSTQFQSSCSPDSSIEQISIDDELGDSNYNGPPPHSSYRGTARQPPRKEARDTGERSRHWGDRNTVQTSDEASSRKAAHSALITQATEKRTPHLRGQFRDSSGKYRGSDINNLSPDELQSSTTIGNHAAASRSPVQRPCRPDSPSQKYSDHQARIITGANASVDLPPSNIRHSNFTSGGAPLGTTAHSGEKTLQWNVELDAIVVDGQLLRAEGLGLVLSQTQDTFSVYQIDKNLTLENPSLQIQPKKLLKINWSSNSRKLHLISSKCEHQDYQLYIQLRTLKSVNDLVHQLQAMGRCEVHQISSERLDKSFEMRLSEQRKFPRQFRVAEENVPLDVQLAAKNIQRFEAKRDESPDKVVSKRRCTVVSRLTGETAPEENMQGQKCQPKRQILLNDVLRTTPEIQDSLSALEGLNDSELDKMPHKFFTQTSNRHLRGSRPGLNSKLFENFYSASKEVPQSSKYSREVDLGLKWKKPLLYPRNCKKKTTVEWSDMERLNEGEYLNDNLISFYLRYLEHQLELERPDLAKKVYFFNTFFFASLTNTQKKQQTINYEAVQKWTRLIDIFAYDYVVVPINESAHWYVAIICNLSALIPNPEFSENLSRNESTPCLNQKEISDDIDDVNEVKEERPNLVFGASERENIPLDVENCNFQDPTSSFAEMTLDTAPKECSTPKNKPPNIESVTTTPKSNDTDQGMLDAQIEGDMAGSTKPQSSELFSNVCDVEKVIESEHIGPLVDENQLIASKKRKRKSIPPIARHDPNTPTIITFDSLGIPHTGTSRALREYLRQEGNAKREMNWEELPIKGITAKEIPQQNNCCDCGLFLLGYIDKFLDDPKDFISSIIKREYNIEKDWPRLNPSDLRASIRKQIQELHAVQEEEHKDISNKMKKTQGRMGNVEPRLLPDSAPLEIRKEPKEPFSLVSTFTETPPTKLKPTRAEALKSALAIDEDEPKIFEGFVSKNPVVAAVVIQTTNNFHKLEPVLGQDESVVVIADSQSDEVTSKPTNPSSSLGHKQESLREAEISSQGQSAPETTLLKSVELPSEIQDSQPSSFHQSPHEETLQTRTGNIGPKIEDLLPLPRSPQRGKHLEGSRRRKSSTPLKSPRAKQRESSIIEID